MTIKLSIDRQWLERQAQALWVGQPGRWEPHLWRLLLVPPRLLPVPFLWRAALDLAGWPGWWRLFSLSLLLGALGLLFWALWDLFDALHLLGARRWLPVLLGLWLAATGWRLWAAPGEQGLMREAPVAAALVVVDAGSDAVGWWRELGLDARAFTLAYFGESRGHPGADADAAPYVVRVVGGAPAEDTVAADGDQLQPGDTAVVAVLGRRLRVRELPGESEAILFHLPDGTAVRLEQGPVAVGEHTWWYISTPTGWGWVQADWLVPERQS